MNERSINLSALVDDFAEATNVCPWHVEYLHSAVFNLNQWAERSLAPADVSEQVLALWVADRIAAGISSATVWGQRSAIVRLLRFAKRTGRRLAKGRAA